MSTARAIGESRQTGRTNRQIVNPQKYDDILEDKTVTKAVDA